jgi:predicted 3-demethylubiquinone-9 3-methyltransferase (glyoxalase superfamily)
MSKVVPCMWFNGDAEEAAKFYVSLVPNSEITHVQHNVSDGPSGKEGSVLVVEFTVAGQPLVALNGGMKMEYTHALSLMIHCDDQAQVDSVWNAFLAHGGKEEQCGWLKDRYACHGRWCRRRCSSSCRAPTGQRPGARCRPC